MGIIEFISIKIGEYFINHLLDYLDSIKIPEDKKKAGNQVMSELRKRVQLLVDIGLYYLRLNRRSRTLSAGEAQRIKIVAELNEDK